MAAHDSYSPAYAKELETAVEDLRGRLHEAERIARNAERERDQALAALRRLETRSGDVVAAGARAAAKIAAAGR